MRVGLQTAEVIDWWNVKPPEQGWRMSKSAAVR